MPQFKVHSEYSPAGDQPQAIEKLAWMCTFEGRRTIGSFKVLGLEEIKDIYRAAR